MGIKFPSILSRVRKWTELYSDKGRRWGMLPSLSAHLALADIERFTKLRGSILDIGCGYGRDLLLFHKVFRNMILEGLESAKPAVGLIRSTVPELGSNSIICSDIFEFGKTSKPSRYDVVFANYFIHLFSEIEETYILGLISKILKQRGICILSWLSTSDRHYGKGRRLGNGCYEVYRGIPWRFVNNSDIEAIVARVGMKVTKLCKFTEVEVIDGKPDRVDGIYLVCAKER